MVPAIEHPIPRSLPDWPNSSGRAILEHSLKHELDAYRRRQSADARLWLDLPALKQALDSGTVGFGQRDSSPPPIDECFALRAAIEAVRDGIVMMFVDQQRILELDLSPEIAAGLTSHFDKRGAVRLAQESLTALSPDQRRALWQLAFPALAEVVELAWTELPGETIARRDGGEEGLGERFTWKLDASQAAHFKFEWLRKLLIVVGPFPDLDLARVIANIGVISHGGSEESSTSYRETSGHFYDSDAPAYLACALLSYCPDDPLAKQVEELFEQQLLGKIPGGDQRATFTAFLCADRPDLWQRIDSLLADSTREPGFLDSLLRYRLGTHPGAWLHFLQTVRDEKLLRIETVGELIRARFGIPWQWKSHKRDEFQPWLERWVEMLESPDARTAAFIGEDPGDFLLALWSEASGNADAAIQRIADSAQLKPDLRIAAAHFLEACRPKCPPVLALKYATDPDLRVANIGSRLLIGWGSALPAASEVPNVFDRLCRYINSLPAKPELKPYPAPFAQRKLDLEGINFSIANSFPDGAEALIESMLPGMDTDSRDAVVRRLNRYRLTDQDRSLAKIIHGDDPDEWQQWIEDHKGEQLLAQRQLLLNLLGDRSMEVAEHAYKAVKDFTIFRDEVAILLPILRSKSAKKRLFVTGILAAQPDAFIADLVPELLTSKRAGERLAALEIIHNLLLDKLRSDCARVLWMRCRYEAMSADEERALSVLREAFDSEESTEAPALGNAFGLVDPRTLTAPAMARDHDVIIHSPVSIRLIAALDEWLTAQAERMIPSTRPSISVEPERVADSLLPNPYSSYSDEKNLSRFPPATDLAEWWLTRPDELRDSDGFEMMRLKVAAEGVLYAHRGRSVSASLFGVCQIVSTHNQEHRIRKLIEWLIHLLPDQFHPPHWRSYLIDVTESLYARLPESDKHSAHIWHQFFGPWLIADKECPEEILTRIWALARNRKPSKGSIFIYQIHQITVFFKRKIATADEIIWHLIGPRKFKDEYDRGNAFSELSAATSPPRGHQPFMGFSEFQDVLQRVCERVIELELGRGESPETWSYAAASIQEIRGAQKLQQCLTAFGKTALTRKRQTRDKRDLTRPAVLIHLIGVCQPAKNDSAQKFAELMKAGGVSTDRLLEIALFRPQWTEFIERATGIDGLRDAVSWIFAHTRSSDYQWETHARELWAGELGFQTPISADEFIAGAVDSGWFERAYHVIGKKVWDKLYAAAKFASTGRGHARVRLFADALLNKTKLSELKKLLEDKGNLDAALAIGLPPLPKPAKARRSELLKRYEILQALKIRSRKSKAQRRASEMAAFEMGVRNLARRAGFMDTLRFEWAMETEAVADFTTGSLSAQIEDLEVTLGIMPDGRLELSATRGEKPLARIPVAAKKHAEFKRLKQRMEELKEQAQRLRPALEDLMVRRVCLSSGEWQQLMLHPLAGPLIARLVLASNSELLGFPAADSLRGLGGETIDWPPPETELYLAHPVDFLPVESWNAWQREIFDCHIVQPFKQVFRELYLPTASEKKSDHGVVTRFQGQALVSHQAFAILSKRGWCFHPDDGLHRLFRNEGITVWIRFDEGFSYFGEHPEVTLRQVDFTTAKPFKLLPFAKVPERIFSEVMRDIDLIVSVAHASGAAPEISASSLESRSALIRETCRLLDLTNVRLDGRFAQITGQLGNYRVHLTSGIVHREPGGMLALVSEVQHERGRIFLPFADDDPLSVDILSRVLLFANDEAIRDPAIVNILRADS